MLTPKHIDFQVRPDTGQIKTTSGPSSGHGQERKEENGLSGHCSGHPPEHSNGSTQGQVWHQEGPRLYSHIASDLHLRHTRLWGQNVNKEPNVNHRSSKKKSKPSTALPGSLKLPKLQLTTQLRVERLWRRLALLHLCLRFPRCLLGKGAFSC